MQSSDVFYRRKRLILENLELLEKKVKNQAQNYDAYVKARFIAAEKQRQKRSILRNFVKLENFNAG